MLAFNGGEDPPSEPTVSTNQDIPNEFDIFSQTEKAFLPPGKTFDDLTPEEMDTLRNQYRFSYFVPGMYQTLTGFKDSMS